MTDDQAIRVYVDCFHRAVCCVKERSDIINEMRAVVAAESDQAGGKIIEWWDCWGPRDTSTMAARKIRRRAAEVLERA